MKNAGFTMVIAAAMMVGARTPAFSQTVATAPPPGSPGIFRAGVELMTALEHATSSAAGMSTSAVANTDQYRINVVRRAKGAAAIAHAGNTEVHYIIDGAATLVTGGTIVRPTGQGATATIQDGVTRHVVKGDVVVIPADSAHWYKDLESPITYLEVRFLAPPAAK